ncbi:MAG: hypothetical protein NTV37_05495 [Proteobacteria bacterium]|nr:hypothetical protein [Pseudomonadota bacterium]
MSWFIIGATTPKRKDTARHTPALNPEILFAHLQPALNQVACSATT